MGEYEFFDNIKYKEMLAEVKNNFAHEVSIELDQMIQCEEELVMNSVRFDVKDVCLLVTQGEMYIFDILADSVMMHVKFGASIKKILSDGASFLVVFNNKYFDGLGRVAFGLVRFERSKSAAKVCFYYGEEVDVSEYATAKNFLILLDIFGGLQRFLVKDDQVELVQKYTEYAVESANLNLFQVMNDDSLLSFSMKTTFVFDNSEYEFEEKGGDKKFFYEKYEPTVCLYQNGQVKSYQNKSTQKKKSSSFILKDLFYKICFCFTDNSFNVVAHDKLHNQNDDSLLIGFLERQNDNLQNLFFGWLKKDGLFFDSFVVENSAIKRFFGEAKIIDFAFITKNEKVFVVFLCLSNEENMGHFVELFQVDKTCITQTDNKMFVNLYESNLFEYKILSLKDGFLVQPNELNDELVSKNIFMFKDYLYILDSCVFQICLMKPEEILNFYCNVCLNEGASEEQINNYISLSEELCTQHDLNKDALYKKKYFLTKNKNEDLFIDVLMKISDENFRTKNAILFLITNEEMFDKYISQFEKIPYYENIVNHFALKRKLYNVLYEQKENEKMHFFMFNTLDLTEIAARNLFATHSIFELLPDFSLCQAVFDKFSNIINKKDKSYPDLFSLRFVDYLDQHFDTFDKRVNFSDYITLFDSLFAHIYNSTFNLFYCCRLLELIERIDCNTNVYLIKFHYLHKYCDCILDLGEGLEQKLGLGVDNFYDLNEIYASAAFSIESVYELILGDCLFNLSFKNQNFDLSKESFAKNKCLTKMYSDELFNFFCYLKSNGVAFRGIVKSLLNVFDEMTENLVVASFLPAICRVQEGFLVKDELETFNEVIIRLVDNVEYTNFFDLLKVFHDYNVKKIALFEFFDCENDIFKFVDKLFESKFYAENMSVNFFVSLFGLLDEVELFNLSLFMLHKLIFFKKEEGFCKTACFNLIQSLESFEFEEILSGEIIKSGLANYLVSCLIEDGVKMNNSMVGVIAEQIDCEDKNFLFNLTEMLFSSSLDLNNLNSLVFDEIEIFKQVGMFRYGLYQKLQKSLIEIQTEYDCSDCWCTVLKVCNKSELYYNLLLASKNYKDYKVFIKSDRTLKLNCNNKNEFLHDLAKSSVYNQSKHFDVRNNPLSLFCFDLHSLRYKGESFYNLNIEKYKNIISNVDFKLSASIDLLSSKSKKNKCIDRIVKILDMKESESSEKCNDFCSFIVSNKVHFDWVNVAFEENLFDAKKLVEKVDSSNFEDFLKLIDKNEIVSYFAFDSSEYSLMNELLGCMGNSGLTTNNILYKFFIKYANLLNLGENKKVSDFLLKVYAYRKGFLANYENVLLNQLNITSLLLGLDVKKFAIVANCFKLFTILEQVQSDESFCIEPIEDNLIKSIAKILYCCALVAVDKSENIQKLLKRMYDNLILFDSEKILSTILSEFDIVDDFLHFYLGQIKIHAYFDVRNHFKVIRFLSYNIDKKSFNLVIAHLISVHYHNNQFKSEFIKLTKKLYKNNIYPAVFGKIYIHCRMRNEINFDQTICMTDLNSIIENFYDFTDEQVVRIIFTFNQISEELKMPNKIVDLFDFLAGDWEQMVFLLLERRNETDDKETINQLLIHLQETLSTNLLQDPDTVLKVYMDFWKEKSYEVGVKWVFSQHDNNDLVIVLLLDMAALPNQISNLFTRKPELLFYFVESEMVMACYRHCNFVFKMIVNMAMSDEEMAEKVLRQCAEIPADSSIVRLKNSNRGSAISSFFSLF